MRNFSRFAVAALASLLAGCSAMRVAYDNADTFLRWRATSYLDLHGEALEDLGERIDAFHAWHREQALPQYARLSAQAAARVESGLAPADIVWGYDAFMAQAMVLLREAAERIAPVLDALAPEQIAHLEARFAEDNRRFARENMKGSEKDRRQLRLRRTRERLDDWLGSLNDGQAALVREFAERSPIFDELRDRERKRLQGEIVALARAKEARKRLPALAADWRQGREPAYAAASDAFRDQYFALLAELDKTLSPAQRAHLAGRLRGYAEDFEALSKGRAQ